MKRNLQEVLSALEKLGLKIELKPGFSFSLKGLEATGSFQLAYGEGTENSFVFKGSCSGALKLTDARHMQAKVLGAKLPNLAELNVLGIANLAHRILMEFTTVGGEYKVTKSEMTLSDGRFKADGDFSFSISQDGRKYDFSLQTTMDIGVKELADLIKEVVLILGSLE